MFGRLRRRACARSQHEHAEILKPKALKEVVEVMIQAVKRREVELDEDALYSNAFYRLVEKNRDTHKSKSIISEKQSSFTNMHIDQETQFQIRSSHVEATSLEVVTETKQSVTVGGFLGGGHMGGKAGIKARYRTENRKKDSKGQSQMETKELNLTGTVKPEHRVVVREITYDLQNHAQGKLDIIVDSNMKVLFRRKEGCKKKGSVRMKKLLKVKPPNMSAIEQNGAAITIHLEADWVYKTVTHNLEFHSEKLPHDYSEQIIHTYGMACPTPPRGVQWQDEARGPGGSSSFVKSSHWSSAVTNRQSTCFELNPSIPQST